MTADNGVTMWIEVDDLIRYFDGSSAPSGVSRVQNEILPHLARLFPGRVGFCRIGTSRSIDLLDYADVRKLTCEDSFLSVRQRRSPLYPLLRVRRFLGRRLAWWRRRLVRGNDAKRFAALVRPGDVLLSLGASWSNADFGRAIGELKQRHGLRFGLMVHDVIPASHPHMVSPAQTPIFNAWLDDMTKVWDFVLTPSKSSASALGAHLASLGHVAPPITPIPFGAGFDAVMPAGAEMAARSHALYVSTIEIRKNHVLLFEVWRRLLANHPADDVPELVFAGKYGWEIEDLKKMLADSRFLDGKIRVVENLSDHQLAALYDGALFTVFPSHCEGWGLPVAESLHFGRYCIASNATSIPEVGGAFVDYHAPDDVDAAYRLIERALFDQSWLAEKERRIAEDYKAPTWEATARAIVAAVDAFATRKAQSPHVLDSLPSSPD